MADWEEDMEDAEDIGVEAETDQVSLKTLGDEVRGKSREPTELKQEPDQIQSQVHDTASEHDVGEPMDEDTMSDLPGERAQVTLESSKTPDRGFSETVIPDSFDGAEE
jgi:hypothetical protein